MRRSAQNGLPGPPARPAETQSLLRTSKLVKVYRADGVTVEAVRGVDIELGIGEFVAIMGPSGSGKSTLLHVLGGLEPATSGEIWLRGQRVDGLSTAAWAIFGAARRWHQTPNRIPAEEMASKIEAIVKPILLTASATKRNSDK